jgi:hypothetical protein
MKQKLVALFLIIVMAASALTVAGLAATTTVAATQRTATTLNLKTKNTGNSYTFYGGLGKSPNISPRISNAKVTLQVSPDDVHWKNAWVTKTNAAGDYAFHLTLKPGHTYYFRTYYAGSSTYREAFSPTVKV